MTTDCQIEQLVTTAKVAIKRSNDLLTTHKVDLLSQMQSKKGSGLNLY